jgi:F-type H+-transporting ATPase subunit c
MRFARLIATGTATCSIIGSSLGVGVIFAGFLEALAKNPELEKILFQYTLLGFALCEAIGVAGLGIVFMLFFGDS